MIRLFIVVGIVGVALITYMATYGQGPDFQMAPAVSLLEKFEAEGVVPAANAVVENEGVEHGIFDVPPQDEVELKKAMSMGGMNMGGKMPMGGDAPANMPMGGGDKTAMPMAGDAPANMPMGGGDKTAMPMAGNAPANMPMGGGDKTAMPMGGDAPKNMPMGGDDKTAMPMAGGAPANMPMGGDGKKAMTMAGDEDQSGLKISEGGEFDREIKLTMAEWKFSDRNIAVKAGEKIRFTIKNGGTIPHEFMFMTMPAMAAINYRATRADWNLLEHEALFEKSLVLPGGKFSFVAEIKKDGAWMFMCMLPYHMQMGMMGQVATPGMAMDMDMRM